MKNTRSAISIASAGQIRKISNPCILSLVMLLAILFTRSSLPSVLIGATLTVLALLIAAPLAYIYLKTFRGKRTGHRLGDPTLFLKNHPRSILALGIACGLPAWLILWKLNAPPEMLYTLMAFMVTALIVAFFNLFYRVSFHLAALTTLILMAVMTWGQPFILLIVAIPIVGWAKHELGEHTFTQITLGIITSAAVTCGIVYGVWR